MMSVTLTPTAEKKPTEVETDKITKAIPNNPNENLEPMNSLRGRRGKNVGAFRESIEDVDESEVEERNNLGKFLAHLRSEEMVPSSS